MNAKRAQRGHAKCAHRDGAREDTRATHGASAPMAFDGEMAAKDKYAEKP